MLFFLGAYFLIAFKSNSLVKILKNESVVILELENTSSNEEKETLKVDLINIKAITKKSISFVAKEKAAEIMEAELGGEFQDLKTNNPFLDVYQFNFDRTKGNLDSLLNNFRLNSTIHNAYVQNSYVDEIAINMKRFSRAALFIGIFFSILAFSLIFNAIKLNHAESKRSFYTLKLLGSDWNFIKKPFLQKAMYIGLASGLIAVTLLSLGIVFLTFKIEILKQIISFWNILVIGLLMIILGLVINIFSTNTILNKYLAMKEEDLYK